jgi:hypothetical protein
VRDRSAALSRERLQKYPPSVPPATPATPMIAVINVSAPIPKSSWLPTFS